MLFVLCASVIVPSAVRVFVEFFRESGLQFTNPMRIAYIVVVGLCVPGYLLGTIYSAKRWDILTTFVYGVGGFYVFARSLWHFDKMKKYDEAHDLE
jgi:hypothetical protein